MKSPRIMAPRRAPKRSQTVVAPKWLQSGQVQAVQPKSNCSSSVREPPAAPPAYRPQLLPKVLQTKRAVAPPAFNQPVRSSGGPAAPPAYRPQPLPKVLQTKKAGAPPVYRPQNTPRLLESKKGAMPPSPRAETARILPGSRVAPVPGARATLGIGTVQRSPVSNRSSLTKPVTAGSISALSSVARRSVSNHRRPAQPSGRVVQLSEAPWTYENYLENTPSQTERELLPEQAHAFAKELAIAAFLHMRGLVIAANKDGTKGHLAKEDIDSLYLYGPGHMGAKEVGAVAYVGTQVAVATNSTVPETGSSAFKNYFGQEAVKEVGSAPLGSNEPCMHAEIKLFKEHGSSLEYIGVSKLCCLYCAAQMLAHGFAGFRGCSMIAFNNYMWLPEINEKKYVLALWGAEVTESLMRAPREINNLFMHYISQGSTLMQKLQHSGTVRSDYSSLKHPLSDAFPSGYQGK